MTVSSKLGMVLVLFIVAIVSLGLLYAPEHFLRQVKFANVLVDDRPVQADAYIGHTTSNEADVFLLVRIQSVGSFLFNFEDEKFREVSSNEFIRLYRSAFTFRPMSRGPWVEPLPFVKLNEFRVKSLNGHIVIFRL
jgi:hypothetical protein